jgi:N-acylneuraminate cytidylyltransferase
MVHKRIAFIFARGGSKGVPNKNIRLLAGKPLIGYAIETAIASKCFDEVVVSTDSIEIADVAKAFGALVPFIRPDHLATDSASEWQAWRHAIRFMLDACGDFDTFVSLPTTSPFRNVADVIGCIKCFESDENVDIVITGKAAERSPYYNMVEINSAGFAEVVIKLKQAVGRRQDAPKVFDITTVAYVAKPSFILNAESIWGGNVRLYEVPVERALDIDTLHDFFIAECIAEANPLMHLKK